MTSATTSGIALAPLGAGELLTHCSGSTDYTGSFVDARGFHTVVMRIVTNNSFILFIDGLVSSKGPLTLVSWPAQSAFLTFLAGGMTISIGFPYATFSTVVNGFAVFFTRSLPW